MGNENGRMNSWVNRRISSTNRSISSWATQIRGVPEGSDVLGASVLVLEVVGMLPHVESMRLKYEPFVVIHKSMSLKYEPAWARAGLAPAKINSFLAKKIRGAPEGSDVLGASVLVLEVVSMLPHVQTQERESSLLTTYWSESTKSS